MKIVVKTLRGTHFDVNVNPQDSVADVKKNIETVKGSGVYPAAQQMLIHQGEVLNDNTTLDENKITENSFVVIMLSKSKSSSGEASTTTSTAPTIKTNAPPPSPAPQAPVEAPAIPASVSAPTPPAPTPVPSATSPSSDVYGTAASNVDAEYDMESVIRQLLEVGGGIWDLDTTLRALRAAHNDPERAIDYLCAGIPGEEVPLPPQPTQPFHVPSTGPNASPLDLFPQVLPVMGTGAASEGTLRFLRNSQQFQALRTMVQANPQILQPMLQELGKQNPHLMRLIQDNQADFLGLINEPAGGGEGNILGELGAAMPQSITVTPEENEAIERLEAMGFDRALVLEVFFACNKNEELAANYLLDHMHEFED